MPEVRCPLCDRPRPRGAARCVCNYTFEFETPARVTVTTPKLASVLVGVAVIAAVAAFLGMPREPGHEGPAYLMIGAGVFAVLGALSNWSWFFGARRARLVDAVLGRGAARVFYAVLGGGLAGAGFALLGV